MKHLLLLFLLCLPVQLPAQAKAKLVQGTEWRNPRSLTVFNGRLMYIARGDKGKYNLWSYNVTNPPEIINVNDHPLGVAEDNFFLHPITASDAYLCLGSFDEKFTKKYRKLYKWNGKDTLAKLEDYFYNFDSNPRLLHMLDNKLYAVMDTPGLAGQLWVYDLNTGKGRRLTTFYPPSLNIWGISNVTDFNGKIYFTPIVNGSGHLLMEYDPVTERMTELAGRDTLFDIVQMTTLGGKLYFTANQKEHGRYTRVRLFMYDGQALKRLTGNSNGDVGFGNLVYFRNKVYYRYDYLLGRKIWAYDPATDMSEEVELLNGIDIAGIGPVYNGKLYFSGLSQYVNNTYILYGFDGVHRPVIIDSSLFLPGEMTVFKDKLYFTAIAPGGVINDPRFLYSYYEPDSSVKGEAKLYPNPAATTAVFSFELSEKQSLSFIITDMSGRIVYRKPLTDYVQGRNDIIIDAGGFAQGVYHCTLAGEDNHSIWTKKLVKE